MPLEPGDIFERFAIMTVDGGLTDLEAVRLLLKRWPLGRGTFQPWNIAMRRIDNLADDARELHRAANASAVMMTRL